MNSAIPVLQALPEVVEAVITPYLCSLTAGSDILKALALGAKAVLLGRPYVYGLTLTGQQDVKEVIQNYRADLELNMGLSGISSVYKINCKFLAYK